MLEVTRFDSVNAYDAKGHFGMSAMRLQGGDVSSLEDFWIGFSTFLPSGGAEHSSSPAGKVYVILKGSLTVSTAEGDAVLSQYDSCFLPPNTERSIKNNTNKPVQMLVISS